MAFKSWLFGPVSFMVRAPHSWMRSDSAALAALILRHLRQGNTSARFQRLMEEKVGVILAR
jgi:hypothetical protein